LKDVGPRNTNCEEGAIFFISAVVLLSLAGQRSP
jgi:hypothetical protein